MPCHTTVRNLLETTGDREALVGGRARGAVPILGGASMERKTQVGDFTKGANCFQACRVRDSYRV